MTRTGDLVSIDCTACGAGLDVLGGGRVVVHICPYCGTELDALDNYRTLRKLTEPKRLESPFWKNPFRIGMSGQLFGVEHTIIGTLGMEERWDGRVWHWVEHQLYSPTHGYAWLSVENGHLVFSRRFRGSGWMSTKSVETSEHRPIYRDRGTIYEYYETSSSQIIVAVGEFTWAPRLGETTTTVSAMAEDAMLDFSETGTEREIFRSVYLDRADVEEGFGISLGKSSRDIHPLQPFRRWVNFDFLRYSGYALALLCSAIAWFFSILPGVSALPPTSVAVSELPLQIPFEVTETDRLARVRLTGNGVNSWSFVEMEVIGPDEEPLFETGRTVEYYVGRDSEGSWREGSNAASVRFIPSETGTYTLMLDVPEAAVWADPTDRSGARRAVASSVTVSVEVGLSSGYWMVLLALGFALLAGYHDGRRWLHKTARWAGSDWTDED